MTGGIYVQKSIEEAEHIMRLAGNEEDFKDLKKDAYQSKMMMLSFYKEIPTGKSFDFAIQYLEKNLKEVKMMLKKKKGIEFKDWKKSEKSYLLESEYVLKQHIEQFNFEFIKKFKNDNIKIDPQAKKFWNEHFGARRFIRLEKFSKALQSNFEIDLQQSFAEYILDMIDYTKDGYISMFDLSKFLTVFGCFDDLMENMITIKSNNLVLSHISTPQANLSLKNKKHSSFLFRFSKTYPKHLVLSFVDSSNKIIHSLFRFSDFLKLKENFLKSLGLIIENNVPVKNSHYMISTN